MTVDPGQAPREDTPDRGDLYEINLFIRVWVNAESAEQAEYLVKLGTKHWNDWDLIGNESLSVEISPQ